MSDRGWGWPLRESKAHYFVDGVSLCGLVHYGGPVERGFPLARDCRTCATAMRSEAHTLAPAGKVIYTRTAFTYSVRSEVRH